MAKGLLINYAGYSYTPSSLMPDNGLASLAGSLIKYGHEVKIIDYGRLDMIPHLMPSRYTKKLAHIYESSTDSNMLMQALNFAKLKWISRSIEKNRDVVVSQLSDELSDLVRKEKADFVGFKLWNGDGFLGSTAMSKKLRKDHPNLPLFAGGPHAYSFKELIFDYMPIDALCYDEGEDTIVQLAEVADKKRELESVDSIFFRSNGNIKKNPLVKIINLNRLPMPVYDPEVYVGIEDKLHMYTIDESRGCIYSCPFCIQSSREDNRYRAKSPERTVDEMTKLMQERGIRSFSFGGQMSPSRLLEGISTQIISRQLDVEFSSFAPIKFMQDADFELLHKAGLKAVFYGVESGSEYVLEKAFNKEMKNHEIKNVIRKTKDAGIKAIASLIYPTPFDDENTREMTVDLILNTRPDSVLTYFPGIYPDTTWQLNPQEYGFTLTTDSYAKDTATYKITNLFPPRFWKPLPYRVNGFSFKDIAMQTEGLVNEFTHNGITQYLSGEHFMMAEALNIDPITLSQQIRKQFYSGDYSSIKTLVEVTNKNVSGI
jgi:anaerobic magnesium-protoporphyrin IX monomethyl ester cyclase